ncbi:ATP-binding protein [Paenibacillus tengchongensis]|uniref:ATP-binding protein n=1 Tax=Paenibacillus tengchongensis TaxID=2608684 RepID=UPI00124D5DC6|nr:ATP-binding protein [Paenibacillus tengchongensis]
MPSFDYRLLAKRMLGLLCIIFLTAAAAAPLMNRTGTSSCALREPGIIDLSSCSFKGSVTYKLDGQWEFYWNQLLEPESALFKAAGQADYQPVPAIWKKPSEGTRSGRFGYATYKVTLALPEDIHEYALKISNIRNASTVYVNGEALGSSGVPGSSETSSLPQNMPYTLNFQSTDGRAEILIHMSNFSYANGGIAESIRLGTSAAIEALQVRNSTFDVVLTVGFAFIGFYFIGQGLQRKEDNASIHLALYCFNIALYMMTHSEKMLLYYFPSIPYEWFSKLQLLTGVAGFYFVAGYTRSLFPKLYSRIFYRITLVYTLAFCTVMLLASVRFYSETAGILIGFSFISVCYTFYVMARAAWHRETGSLYLLIGVIAAIMFTLSVGANLFLGMDFYAILPVAGPIFILSEAMFLSARQAHAYETIKQLSLELARKDRDKDAFLLKTSNELRTPLNAVINLSLSLYEGAGGPLSVSQREDLRLILGTSRRLAFLVRDILDYEQIKGQRIVLHAKPVDIQSAASIVVEIFEFLNPKTSVRIKNRIPPGQYIVEADEHRLMQIIFNLLDNALKFTDRGSVILEAEIRAGLVAVTVSDTGSGIAPQQLELIFQDYEQASESDSLERGGAGLGLPITRKLVELHGGSIEVSSEPGRGSSFAFTLPLVQEAGFEEEPESRELLLNAVKPPPEAAGDNWKYPQARPAGSREAHAPRILVVDDDYANLKALTNLLALENYAITSLRSGAEALELLKEDRSFDLCIIDVMMPQMSGFQLCRSIRRTFSPLDLPILMATAAQELHLTELAFRAGANDFIHKPYAWNDLKGRVKTLVQLRRSVSERLTSEIAMLRAQIKPHFLYNAINTIIWMSTRDHDKTRSLLYDLSNFLRGSFDFSNQETAVPFEKELELIEAYLSLEQARFGKRLRVEYDIDVFEFSLPPLIVQPIVENAVRHGLMEKIGGGTVTLSTRRLGSSIVIKISDDGIGMSDELLSAWMKDEVRPPLGRDTGIGLKNINRRLLKQFGTPLQLSRRTGGGIEAIITIPWKDEDS